MGYYVPADRVTRNGRGSSLRSAGSIVGGLFKGFRETLFHLFTRPVTMHYPEERPKLSSRYRGYPKLIKEIDGTERCVACKLCEVVCPPRAIFIQPGELPDDPKERYPTRFEIHMGRCIVCGYCAEACPEDAIEMSYDFELATPSLDSLIYRKEFLVREPLEREKR